MKKKAIFYVFLDLIFLLVFNISFFVISGVEHTLSVWLSYGFIHLSYLMVLLTPVLIRKSSSANLFRLSISAISATYFFVEFIAGLVFIIIESESYKISLVVQVVIAGVYVVLLVSNLIANENTAESLEQHENEVSYIKNVASRVKILVEKVSDKNAKKEIEKTYDFLHSSPSCSLIAVKKIEEEISNKITDLENAVVADETAEVILITGDILAKAEERNRIIRMADNV